VLVSGNDGNHIGIEVLMLLEYPTLEVESVTVRDARSPGCEHHEFLAGCLALAYFLSFNTLARVWQKRVDRPHFSLAVAHAPVAVQKNRRTKTHPSALSLEKSGQNLATD